MNKLVNILKLVYIAGMLMIAASCEKEVIVEVEKIVEVENTDKIDTLQAQVASLQAEIDRLTELKSEIDDLQRIIEENNINIANLESDLASALASNDTVFIPIVRDNVITNIVTNTVEVEVIKEVEVEVIVNQTVTETVVEYVTNVVTVTIPGDTITNTVTVVETNTVTVEVPVVEYVEVIKVVTETQYIEIPKVVTETIIQTEVVTQVVYVTETVTEVIEVEVEVEVEVEKIVYVEVEVEVEKIVIEYVEVTPLTFVGDGGLKLYSASTLDDNNFVTYNLFKTASSTWIDLSDIKSMISVDTDLSYTVQVVNPVSGDNKLSVRITFTNGNPTEGIIVASISGAYYDFTQQVAESNVVTETEESDDDESEDDESEDDESEVEEVVCDVDKFSTMITTNVSSPSWNEWENLGSPAKADPTEEFTTQVQIRSGVQTTTLTSVKTYLPCSGKASETTVTEYADDVEEEQTIQVANPDYDESVVEINGYFYDEMIVSSIASVTYTPWSDWVTQGLVDVSNRTRTNFTIQITAYLGLEGNEPAVANNVENIDVVTTVETKESVVINVHGNYERVDVGGTHGITNFKAGDTSSYNVYLNGNLNSDPLLTINLTGSGGSGSSKKNGYTINYSFDKDAANNYWIDLSVTSDVNIHVVLNN